MFVDRALIEARAGRGGDGCVSFLREAHRAKGGPDGGDGGDGGSVIVRATTHRSSLRHLASRTLYKAENGRPGLGKNKSGRRGESLILEVPPGTLIYPLAAGEREAAEDVVPIADLTEHGQEFELEAGGRGGRGNATFATALNQAPRVATRGGEGRRGRYRFELKLIAEVGIVGLPNAGKSTFISRVSAAKPKIASYPFTTLVPNLGVVEVDGRDLVLADIPGLIEGASEGRGLGDDFLRHVERTRVLLHLIDATSEEMGGPSLLESYRTIRGELERYPKAALDTRPEVLAINKIDALPAGEAERRAGELAKATGVPVTLVSAVSGVGTQDLLSQLSKVAAELAEKERAERELAALEQAAAEGAPSE